MEEESVAKVIAILLDKYVLESKLENELIEAVASGNTKKKGSIKVGDFVRVRRSYDKYIITEVMKRKNDFIRPPVANIDQLVIVLSLDFPVPDYMLLDKELILCMEKNIKPIICVNKLDLLEENEELESDLRYLQTVYAELGVEILYISTRKKKTIEELKKKLRGKVSAFSGNSGVGKSSITKELIDAAQEIEIGTIGKKSNRGKHTTKHVKLYRMDENSYILDTPGFSSYELYDVSHKELKKYYPEFLECDCEYENCAHVIENEMVCDVKRKVIEGKIDQNRYDRYVYLYQKLKEQEDNKYKRR